jgi:hypothetical protein
MSRIALSLNHFGFNLKILTIGKITYLIPKIPAVGKLLVTEFIFPVSDKG